MPDEFTPTVERIEDATESHVVEAVEGSQWDVTLLKVGPSLNRRYYPAATLKKAVALFEGTDVYWNHTATPGNRDARDKAGKIRDVQFSDSTQSLKGRLVVVNRQLRQTLLEAAQLGEGDFLGLSVSTDARIDKPTVESQNMPSVGEIVKAYSVDIVAQPAAGGRIERLLAAVSEGVSDMPDDAVMTPEQVTDLVTTSVSEAVAAAIATFEASHTPPPPADPPKPDPEPVNEALVEVRKVQEQLRVARGESRITAALATAKMSEPGKTRVRKLWEEVNERRAWEDAELTQLITETQDYEGAVAQQHIRPIGAGNVLNAVGMSGHDQLVTALKGFFGDAEAMKQVTPLASLKEGYCRWTGTDAFDLDPMEYVAAYDRSYYSGRDHKKVQESLMTTDWGQMFADVFHLQVVKEYAEDPYNRWRMIVSDIENVPDFQTRHWARVGGYGDLGTVAQGATYPVATTPGDEEITYVLQKRGLIEDVTIETLLGDRVGKVRTLPRRLAQAASRTMFKFVLGLATTDNPTMDYDTTALYHSDHGNTGTTALSVAGLDATRTAMRDQTPFGNSSEILGPRNVPKVLIVPNELEARALRITNPSDGYTFALSSTPDADTSMDPARFKGEGLEVLVYDQMTDANNWFTVANPSQVPTIVIGFLGGATEPELFVQDDPRVGSVFTSDKVSYKIRHVYGGDVLEHRSFYRQVVS